MALTSSRAMVGELAPDSVRGETEASKSAVAAGCERVVWLVFLALLVLVPLAFVPAADDIFTMPKVTMLRWLTVIAIAAIAIRVLVMRQLRLRGTALDVPMVAYVAITALATALSVDPIMSFYGRHLRHDGLLTVMNYAVVLYIAANVLTSFRRIWYAVTLLVATASFIALLGVAQFFGLTLWDLRADYFSFRAFSTLGNPDFLGTYLVLILPLSLSLVLMEKRVSRRILWSALSLFVALGLVTTLTRGAWLGGMAAILLFAILAWRHLAARMRWVAFGSAASVAVVAALMLAPRSLPATGSNSQGDVSEPSVAQVAQSITNTNAGTGKIRLLLWQGALEVITERPVLGGGIDSFMMTFGRHAPLDYARTEGLQHYPDKAHNEFLDIATSSGILGLGTYLWLLGAAALVIWRGVRGGVTGDRRRLLLFALAASLFGYVVQSLFLFSVIDTATIFWALLGLTLVVCKATTPRLARSISFPRFVTAPLLVVALAVAALGLFLAAKPFVADLYFRQAQLVFSQMHSGRESEIASGRMAQALDLQRRALDWYPQDEELFRQYDIMLRAAAATSSDAGKRTADLDEGVRAISRAIAMNPTFSGYYYDRGQTYEAYGDDHLLDAMADYRQSLFRYPTSYEDNLALANVAHRLNLISAAITAERMALMVFPHDSKAMFDLGLDYFRVGSVDAAMSEWQQLAKFEPRNAILHYWLGQAYASKGSKENAATEYEQALAIDPGLEQATKAQQELLQK